MIPMRPEHALHPNCAWRSIRDSLLLGGGLLRSFVPPSGQRAGRVSLFRARFACARLRGRGRAYRGGAVRARDCPRETAGTPRPPAPAGVFFAAPSHRFLQKSRKAAPGEPPLSTFILSHFASGQALPGTKREISGDFSSNAGSTAGAEPFRTARHSGPVNMALDLLLAGAMNRDEPYEVVRARSNYRSMLSWDASDDHEARLIRLSPPPPHTARAGPPGSSGNAGGRPVPP